MIDKETIDKIFDAAHIEDVVGDVVMLKKRGTNLLGLCPFHNEKTPSFTVSPAKGIYKCFGCGKGGNAVNFVMELQQFSYPEALKYLAKKYNIEIEEEERTPEQELQQNERESLFIVSAFAQKHFTENLHNTDEGKAIGLSYFKERSFRNDIIEKFQLGYSHDKWSEFTDTAVANGYKLDYLVKAGLTISANEKTFDRFSARVMFPIHNLTGRVIAFGGRTLKADKKTAKYINSPETDIYSKGKVLYGAFFAKKSIIAEDNCYLVEGYTDVISMHQAGIENVVASSGTSLTVEQIRQIRRYTNNITILYDGDAAGIKASFRGIDLILEEAMNVRVLLFPDGEDPDSFSKRLSTEELKSFIKENSKDFISFKTSLLYGEVKSDPIKKAGLIKEIVESIAIIPEAIIRSVYIKECSDIMGVDEQILLNELNKIRRTKTQKREDASQENQAPATDEFIEPKPQISSDDCEHQEKDVIRILLNFGQEKVSVEVSDDQGNKSFMDMSVSELIINELSGDEIAFENPIYEQIYQEISIHIGKETVPGERHFLNHPDKNINKLAIDLATSPYTLSENWEKHGIFIQTEKMSLRKSVSNAVNSLKIRKLEKMRKNLNLEIQKTYQAGEDVTALLARLNLLEAAKKHFSAQLGRIILK